MTAGAVHTGKISLEEYLEKEYASETRHEYIDGIVREMPYTSENHQLIVANLLAWLVFYYKDKQEKVLASDRLIRVHQCNRMYYPEITIFPEKIEYQPYKGKMKSALNPVVIIEVLSETTEAIDRGEKFNCYQTIPSLQQYVLVSQTKMKVEIFTRQPAPNEWLYKSFETEADEITILGSIVPLKDIYLKVDFDNEN